MRSFRIEKFQNRRGDSAAVWDDKYAPVDVGEIVEDEFRRQGFWPVLERELTPGGRYLDIGCGMGGWLRFLRGAGYTVEGVEVAAQTVARLTRAGIEGVVVGSITALPYSDAVFDGAYALGVLEYVNGDVPRALAEVRRVLQPGGWFLLEVPVANPLRRLAYIPLKRLEKIVRVWQGKRAVFSHIYFDRGELRAMLQHAGFAIVSEQPHDLVEKDRHHGLWIDWPFLRGGEHSQLNWLGRIVKKMANAISPWVASTGTVILARKTG